MPTIGSMRLEPIAPEKIQELLTLPGPCLTLLLPPFRPGDGGGTPGNVLRGAIRETTAQFENRKVPQALRAEMLAPIEAIAVDPALNSGSHASRAILSCPDCFEQFELTMPAETSATVSGSFAIRRLFAEMSLPRTFYLLSISKESVSLHRGSGWELQKIELPSGVPATLAEAMDFKPPDHDLENRSTVGGSAAPVRGVRFGTGSEKEGAQAHLADYYRLVDRAVQALLHNADVPLILQGVDEDTTLYKSVSNSRSLLDGTIRGTGKPPNAGEIVAQCYAVIQSEKAARAAKLFLEAKERTGPTRFLTELEAILFAAFEGRVNQLFVSDSAEQVGVFERPGYRSWGSEDLLNLAMIQTLRHRGKVYVVPGNEMNSMQVAAGLRF